MRGTTIGFDNDTDTKYGLHHHRYNHASHYLPSFINLLIAIHKTLVSFISLDTLHFAKNPTKSDTVYQPVRLYPIHRKILCTHTPTPSMTATTTCMSLATTYETREFPRAREYLEDSASGITAATIASSLQQQNHEISNAIGTGGVVVMVVVFGGMR